MDLISGKTAHCDILGLSEPLEAIWEPSGTTFWDYPSRWKPSEPLEAIRNEPLEAIRAAGSHIEPLESDC